MAAVENLEFDFVIAHQDESGEGPDIEKVDQFFRDMLESVIEGCEEADTGSVSTLTQERYPNISGADLDLAQTIVSTQNALRGNDTNEKPGRIFVLSAKVDSKLKSFVAGSVLDSRKNVAHVFTHYTHPDARGQGIMRAIYERLGQEFGGSVDYMTTIVSYDEPDTEENARYETAKAALEKLGYVNAELDAKGERVVPAEDPSDFVMDLSKRINN